MGHLKGKEECCWLESGQLHPAPILSYCAPARANIVSSSADDFAEEEEVQSFGYKRFGESWQSLAPSPLSVWDAVTDFYMGDIVRL